ncbi:hypothetical protein [Hydrocarboniclastica marina]|uniref:Uncharacterized protein n=1 Tax=Hydrocarboniclastica marina TaxID=2259620 RepID=A0A4P7XJS4_9ALTE|nr:hypothetical protein [Hydrocarboniclastica marina]MAM00106.1 hypothetical protein [Alteromonadaceae bacterium]QCF27419.1 hypothetical protein soil367_16620 [Hydrocarboniclastica marina]|tara:strand:+ start:1018 stop:1554 length:537 start_codon:yes stop_codon:yes gene_type:complete
MFQMTIRQLLRTSLTLSPEIYGTARAHANVIRKNAAINELSHDAIQMALLLAPPIVYRGSDGAHYCAANLRSLHLAQRLPENTKIAVLVVPQDELAPLSVMSAQLELIGTLCAGLDERFLPGALRMLWEALPSSAARRELSEDFVSKTRFAEVTGTNRRDFSRRTKPFRSEFRAWMER